MQKAQGIIIPAKVTLSLLIREKEHGLTHVAQNRVTKFSNMGIEYTEELSKNRFF